MKFLELILKVVVAPLWLPVTLLIVASDFIFYSGYLAHWTL